VSLIHWRFVILNPFTGIDKILIRLSDRIRIPQILNGSLILLQLAQRLIQKWRCHWPIASQFRIRGFLQVETDSLIRILFDKTVANNLSIRKCMLSSSFIAGKQTGGWHDVLLQ